MHRQHRPATSRAGQRAHGGALAMLWLACGGCFSPLIPHGAAADVAKTKKAYIGYIGVHLTNTRTN